MVIIKGAGDGAGDGGIPVFSYSIRPVDVQFVALSFALSFGLFRVVMVMLIDVPRPPPSFFPPQRRDKKVLDNWGDIW